MAKARKDIRGRALWKGECQRVSDKRYVYTYTDTYGKRRSIYANDLAELRKKEQGLLKDQFDGIDSVKARNKMFERYIACARIRFIHIDIFMNIMLERY